VFKSNSAEGNGGIGFDVATSGVVLDTNAAEENSGLEWSVAAGNVDDSGNKANGNVISIPPAGGTFE
jgi:hypothetical protein